MRLRRKSMKISKVSLMLSWMLLLQMVLQPFAVLADTSEPIEGFTLIKTASKPVVEVGEEFDYTIDFAFDGGTIQQKQIVIVDVVPSRFEIVTVPTGWVRSGQTLTWTGTMSAGDTARSEIRVKALPTGVNEPVDTINTAVATEIPDINTKTTASAPVRINNDPNPVAPTPEPTPTPVEVTYDEWRTFKYQDKGGSTPIIGGTVIYTVGIQGTAGNTDTGSLNNVTLVDQLPHPLPDGTTVTFPNNPAPGDSERIYNSATGTITWTIPSIGSGQRFEDKIQVKFPDYYGYGYTTADPLTETNTVTLTTYGEITGSGSIGGGSSSVTTRFGPPVAGVADLNKAREFQYRYPGQNQKFTISGIRNNITNANSSLTDLVLIDTLPPELDYTSISLPGGWSKFEYESSISPGTWQLFTLGTPGTARTVSIGDSTSDSDIKLAGGEYLTRVKWTFDELNAGSSISNIIIEGVVRSTVNGSNSPVVHGDEVTNTVSLNYKVMDATDPNVGRIDAPEIQKSTDFLINNQKPWLEVNKNHGSGSYGPNSIVPFTVTVGNNIKATGPYVNPVIYDILPKEFDYYTNPLITDKTEALQQSFQLQNAPVGLLSNPKIEVLDTQIDGRTVVKWYWDDGSQLLPGQSFNITYSGQVKLGTAQNDAGYTNEVYITTLDPDTQFWHQGDPASQNDPDDLSEWRQDNESIRETLLPTGVHNEYYVKDSVNIPIGRLGFVQSTKWNRGDLEPIFRAEDNPQYSGDPGIPEIPFEFEGVLQYTEFPYYSVTFEGGTADYRLVIRNTGNTRIDKIDVLDILPHVGDTALLSQTQRGTQWQPNLAEVLKSEDKVFTSTQETGALKVEYTLAAYYSKSADQSTVVNFDNARGAKQGWTAQSDFSGDNLTDIKSLYFEITNITGSDDEEGLKPGDYIVLDWKMNAPVGAPTNEIAWNSFAIQTKEIDRDNYMLPTAPNKVGFIIDPDSVHLEKGEIGDFVWFDSNRDGIQDEGYDGDNGQKAGINGITVRLYEDGNPDPIRTSVTGYDIHGNPGYYLFQGLETGDYYVEFVLPEYYEPTLANANGADPNQWIDNDSNYVTKGTTDSNGYTSYRTNKIEIDPSVSGIKKSNRTIDLGIVEVNQPDYPEASLEKTVQIQKGSASLDASDSYALEGNRLFYTIEFINKSAVTLHNIKIEDVLEEGQPGFVFTKLIYDDEEIALNGNAHNRPDIVTALVNSGGAAPYPYIPYIVLKSLDAGARIELEGYYDVTASDIDGTDIINKARAYYNEAPEPLEDTVNTPVAAFEVEKTGSAGRVTAAGQEITYTVTIRNLGSYPLTNLVITDTLVPDIPVIDLLPVGETEKINYFYTVLPEDVLAGGLLSNTVKVKPDETPEDEDTHDIPVDVSQPAGSIGDYVWLDSNEDGIQDAGEQGINGIKVYLYFSRSGTPYAETTTQHKDGQDGYYLFSGLPKGTYYVQFEIPVDYVTTAAEAGDDPAVDSNQTDADGFTNAIIIGSDQWDDHTIDLGLIPRGSIGDYVWLDANHDGIQDAEETGINGVTVYLYKDSTEDEPIATTTTTNDTDGNPGYYLFDHLLQGDYYVQFSFPADYEKTLAEQGDDRGTDSNYTNSDHITNKIVVGPDQWVDFSIDLGLYPKGIIGDYVWLDQNINGKQDEDEQYGRNGVTVQLYDENRNLIRETVTADDDNGNPGYYLFDNLLGGDYYVRFLVPGGYITTIAEASGVDPAEDSNRVVNGYTDIIRIGEESGWVDLTIDLGLRYVPYVFPPLDPEDPEEPVVPEEPGTEPEEPGTDPEEPGTPEPGPTPEGPGVPEEPGTTDPTPTPVPSPTPTPETIIEVTDEDTPVGGVVEVPEGSTPSVGTEPEHGTVTVDEDGTWTYTPDPGFVGEDSFSIIVTDPDGNETEYLIEIDVEEVPLGGIDVPVTELPKTGQRDWLLWQLTGVGLLAVGAILRKRHRMRQ